MIMKLEAGLRAELDLNEPKEQFEDIRDVLEKKNDGIVTGLLITNKLERGSLCTICLKKIQSKYFYAVGVPHLRLNENVIFNTCSEACSDRLIETLNPIGFEKEE